MKTMNDFEATKKHIPDNVKRIIDRLSEFNHRSWLVGGCVRDLILEKVPVDWDICTSALPEEIISIFEKTVPTGIKHGTITVIINDGTNGANEAFEVTTLRIDGVYKDNRRPESVVFTKDIEHDLARRDFTMNSIALDINGEYVDPFGGIEDIEAQLIRSVGDPDKRFNEDGLRMIRAIRFHAQLGFEIHEATIAAIKKNASLINNISPERIKIELEKIITSENPGLIYSMSDFGLLEHIIPELLPSITTYQNNTFHEQTVAVHTSRAMKAADDSPLIRWAVLFHDIGKPNMMTMDDNGVTHFYGHEKESSILAEHIMRRLKFSREYMDKIVKLILVHDLRIEPTEKSIRRAVNRISEELFPLFIKIKKADISGQHPRYYEERLKRIPEIETLLANAIEKHECFSLRSLHVNGSDIIKLGFKPGREIGEILNQLLELVLDDPELNKYEILIEKARELKDR